jgi:hypothetical protein
MLSYELTRICSQLITDLLCLRYISYEYWNVKIRLGQTRIVYSRFIHLDLQTQL